MHRFRNGPTDNQLQAEPIKENITKESDLIIRARKDGFFVLQTCSCVESNSGISVKSLCFTKSGISK